MTAWTFVVAALLVLMACWLYVSRRPAIAAPAARPLPPDWRGLVARRIVHAAHLSPELRKRFEHHVQTFLVNKRFYGCNGLVVTDEMRVLVAAQACLLILRGRAEVFPRLRSVLLYPAAFWVPHQEPDDLGLVSDGPVEQIGESWDGDRVVLSWADVEAALNGDAVNVVVHEFAHQLDIGQGFPAGVDPTHWAPVMRKEFERLQRHRRPPVLDPYGAEGPEEFFAVATEAYFQRGTELQQHHPELYQRLREFYVVETAGELFPDKALKAGP